MIKRKLAVLFILLFSVTSSFSQTTLWLETFNNGCTANCNANGVNTGNGAWVVTNNSPALDACGFPTSPNQWYVSCSENGNAPGACGTGCGANASLHVSSTTLGDLGAAYDAGGWCAFGLGGFGDGTETDIFIESPTINLTGQTGMTLTFDYIENGQANLDDASLHYFDGAVWTILDPLAKTPLCGSGQGQWTTFSIALPASANNNPNVKIGFRWVNNDDGMGTDPSFAVNDVRVIIPLVTPPVADFTANSTSICEGSCIDFTNTSTFATGATFSWNFGDGQTSTAQNPTNICYNNAGSFTVTLTVTDANGVDTETKTNYIVVTAAVNAGADNTGSVCNNTSIDLNSLLLGADSGGTWIETTGTPSGQFNTSTAILNAVGLTPGNYTFSYTLTGTSPCTNDIANFTITVNDCSADGPTAIISVSNGTVCQGQSLIFNSTSIGTNISSEIWSFGGGTPGTATGSGPHSVTFNTVGNFIVLLTVTDDFGTHDTTITVQVVTCSVPTAAFAISDATPCSGDCITFTNNSSSISTPTYNWTFAGGTPSSSTSANPGQICYTTPGTYTATLVVTNSFGTGSYSQNITVLPPPSIDAYGDAFINLGDNTTIGATVTEGTIAWSWTPNNQGNILTCSPSDCSQAIVSPAINTIFTATVTTSQGCSASDNVIIGVNVPSTGYALGVPNSFSPNGDNNNDILYVNGLGISTMVFRVFNRYGQLVFESDDQSIGWNGNFNGEPLNSATFAWTLECVMVDGASVKLNGNVTLLK
jgi:gliding motility-associated-like protein